MFRFISIIAFLYTSFALNPQTERTTIVKQMIRVATPPMVNNALFSSNIMFKGVSPAFLREAELKHGRIAMLASVILPTLEQFTDGLAINQFQELPDVAQLGLVSMMFMGEFGSMVRGWENPTEKPFRLKEDYQPGDLGFQLWKGHNEESLGVQMDKELNNGRLAMIGVFGMICQELATGQQLF